MSVNKVILVGNVGNDPEVTVHDNGKKLAKFTLATTKKWKSDNGEQKESTVWHNIAMFSRLADVCQQYIKSGSRIYIEGSINNSKFVDEMGLSHHYSQVVGQHLMIL